MAAPPETPLPGIMLVSTHPVESPTENIVISEPTTLSPLEKIAENPNRTPYGLSRWIVLAIFCVYSFLAGPCYWNWTPLADVLFVRGAYEWNCTEEDWDFSAKLQEPKCNAQDVAVQRLFTISMASDFSFSALSGLLLDYAGPKVTGLFGTVVLLVAWCLWGAASHSVQTFVPAAVLWGVSFSAAFFPCLSVANLFPTSRNTVIAVLGSCRSLANLIPLLLRALALNEPDLASSIFYYYGGCCIGICVCTALLFLPTKPWQRLPALIQAAGIVPDVGESPSEAPVSPTEASAAGARLASIATGRSLGTLSYRASTFGAREERGGEHVDLLEQAALRKDTIRTLQRGTTATQLSKVSDWRAFFGEVFSAVFLPLCVYEALTLVANSFFASASRRLLPQAYEANQIIQIFAFVPAPLLGFVADQMGILTTMCILNGSGLVAFVLAMVPQVPAAEACQYLAALSIMVNNSFIISQVYCYVNQSFPEGHAGKLIGLACLVAGLPSLAANPMLQHAVDHGFTTMMTVSIFFLAVNFLIIASLAFLRRRRARKILADTEEDFTQLVS
ncbi:major facilitator family protein [Cystoisospora suis]|uniref:Major facilitator family protein n=1 Tax=Cystoisospora suis TaxID=483139 RepID=A0A2C6KYA8_9APIC|nr:major facilitator family protein [Cystoisospora suis]